MGDFDLARIMWLRFIQMILNFVAITIFSPRFKMSLTIMLMSIVGTFAAYAIFPSEILKNEAVKVPYIFLCSFTWPGLFWVYYTRSLRYSRLMLIL